jgi:hypothetical protein
MWSLREEHKLQVFENKMLRELFEPKKDKVSKLVFIILNLRVLLQVG